MLLSARMSLVIVMRPNVDYPDARDCPISFLLDSCFVRSLMGTVRQINLILWNVENGNVTFVSSSSLSQTVAPITGIPKF
jgi:hypothetical protein